MDTHEIRQLFTGFFEAREHRRIPSASLIPANDPTLLFTNAGMVQFKPYFMAVADPPAPRLTSIQKCFRTSDIEEVGDDSHCTFFEMLGNFSIGDYFKSEVIPWAWELLTSPQPQGLGLSKERLWATIYNDDDEAFELWRKVGVPAERIVRYGEKENYWFAGPVGPCGPNSEINYDFGRYEGWQEHECHPNCVLPGCHRFLEIWNLVFMTLFQSEDGSRTPLPQPNVDTGAGLERWTPPLLWEAGVDWQGKKRNWKQPPAIFDTDLFKPIVARVSQLAGLEYEAASDEQRRAIRVVAEHARAATFLLADGMTPANDGRGYVLRRLIRRATSFGQGLAPGEQFLAATAESVIDLMRVEHQNLEEQRRFVNQTLAAEESRFFETLLVGQTQLEDFKRQHPDKRMAGAEVFQLWDTHGFPPELTMELLEGDGFSVADPESFEALMEEQRSRSRAATRFEGDAGRVQTYSEIGLSASEFVGYETTRALAVINAIVLGGSQVIQTLTPETAKGKKVELVLDHTPFYPEGGGQVGDRGEVIWPGGRFLVEDTQSIGEGGLTVHIGELDSGSLSVGDPVEGRVDEQLRYDTMRNHTATHLLHAALRQVLGSHARQAGSLVTPDRLRFDFTHVEGISAAEIRAVEELANKAVRENILVSVEHQSYEDALEGGALAFFGDKYADIVRVVGVCDDDALECFSKELCGGTHVHASGDIGSIVITGESSIGAGLRRIEAVTGRVAAERVRQQEDIIARLSSVLQTPATEIDTRVVELKEEVDDLQKAMRNMERRIARVEADSILAEAIKIADVSVIVARVSDAPNADFLRDLGDGLKSRLGEAIILLASTIDGKPAFLAMATPAAAKLCGAGDIVRVAAREAGGGGGGRPELAQGGGNDAAKVDSAIEAGRRLIETKLAESV